MQELEIIGSIFFGLLMMFSISKIAGQSNALEDPENNEVIYPSQLLEVTLFHGSGEYVVQTYRQSGNLQQEDRVFDNHTAAIKAAISTFKRAKIDYVCVTKNTACELFFRRPYHDHKGRSEGKKVGSIKIVKVLSNDIEGQVKRSLEQFLDKEEIKEVNIKINGDKTSFTTTNRKVADKLAKNLDSQVSESSTA